MIDLNDPDMREIVVEFCDESDTLLTILENHLENFEDNPSEKSILEEFGQVIDRMMGAAQTLGASEIGDLCQMGKIIGYKASQNDNQALNEMTAGVLFDLVDVVQSLITNLREQKDERDFDTEAFIGRLNWISGKFKHIERASCDFEEEDEDFDFDELDDEDLETTAELDALIARFDKAG